MIETNGAFYLGRVVDAETAEVSDKPLLYDPADLTTHAVVVGMTGSGKTGLCLDMLEEAALNHIPALMIDPKGDITNAVLHFPELRPADFEPWINPDEARRDGKSVAEAAADTASLWRNGLADWAITPERLQRLKESVQFAIYTPGSTAGLPVSILASLKAPPIPWAGNEELLREQISGTVTAVLGLVGLKDIDPVRSREHILLANIFEEAWKKGQDLDLGELIMQTQSPPFAKLGVFEVNQFFPEKERFALAMQLNSILAAPAFQSWIEGDPLDVGSLLYGADGQPRHTIFYIAHLSDDERMFFVTLLYSAVESWMRTQAGTTSLRALVYFDEIYGYLPPVGNPPSKKPMLRLLKQARAFGIGMVLATQNPVDLDYKGLSNAGSWFIGKLGTDQDKQRLLDGLATAAAGGLNRGEYDHLISAIGKRVFLMRNVHEKQPVLFNTRWAMNYLAGPMTRTQIPALNELAGAMAARAGTTAAAPAAPQVAAVEPVRAAAAAVEAGPSLPGTTARPAVPGRMAEYFLPHTLTLSQAEQVEGARLPLDSQPLGLLYRPVLLAQADVRFTNRKYNLDYALKQTAIVPEPDRRGTVSWGAYTTGGIDTRSLDNRPVHDARFDSLEEPLSSETVMRALERDFQEWVYREAAVTVRANEALGIYAGPDVSEAEFAAMCQKAAAEKASVEADKLEAQFEKKIDSLETKLSREERELESDRAEYNQRKMQEAATHAETLFSLFSKRRRSVSSSMTKRRMTARAADDVKESEEEIARLKKDIDKMEAEMQRALDDLEAKWNDIADDTTEIKVTPYKKDIVVELFGVAWLPYHLVDAGGRLQTLAGFAAAEET
jgi:hypothetical protein